MKKQTCNSYRIKFSHVTIRQPGSTWNVNYQCDNATLDEESQMIYTWTYIMHVCIHVIHVNIRQPGRSTWNVIKSLYMYERSINVTILMVEESQMSYTWTYKYNKEVYVKAKTILVFYFSCILCLTWIYGNCLIVLLYGYFIPSLTYIFFIFHLNNFFMSDMNLRKFSYCTLYGYFIPSLTYIFLISLT